MSACAAHAPTLPTRKKVSINGVTIPHAQIAQEAQNFRAESPADAFSQAARALVIRELLLQEARRLDLTPEPASDDDGRRETDEEALIRALIDSRTSRGEPDEASCRRFYDDNLSRFRSADLFEAAHILIAAAPADAKAVTAAREAATGLIKLLQSDPSGFADAARVYSACTSRDQGGALGQFARGQCAPEFEEALDRLEPGEISAEPAQTVHGLHVLRLDRKIEGATLPFDFVRPRIEKYLGETRGRHAIAGYIAHLAQQATIEGVMMAPGDATRRGASHDAR
jgi:peptidyl-prolyl cis-trans isomerase C